VSCAGVKQPHLWADGFIHTTNKQQQQQQPQQLHKGLSDAPGRATFPSAPYTRRSCVALPVAVGPG
jgi:hypothetical protein